MEARSRRLWATIAGLLLIAAILPGIIWEERALTPDSNRYLGLGASLLRGGGFADSHGQPEALTPPLYPLLAGVATLGGIWARALLLGLQALLFAATLFFWWRTLLCVGVAQRTAVGAVLVLALSPLPLIYAGRILSETLALFLLLSGGYLLCRANRGAGLLLGAAALTRSIFWPALLIGLLAGLSVRGLRRMALWALVGLLLVTGAWMIRNQITFGSWRLVPLTGTTAQSAHLAAPPEAFVQVLTEVRGPEQLENPFAEGDARARAALRLIRTHPGRFARRMLLTWPVIWAPPIPDLMQSCGHWPAPAGLLTTLRISGPRAAWQGLWARLDGGPVLGALVLLVAFWDLLISGCAAIGLLILLLPRGKVGSWRLRVREYWPRPARTLLLVLALPILVLLVAPAGVYHPRFRLPLAPVLALLAYPVLSACWMSAKRAWTGAGRRT